MRAGMVGIDVETFVRADAIVSVRGARAGEGTYIMLSNTREVYVSLGLQEVLGVLERAETEKLEADIRRRLPLGSVRIRNDP